GKTVGKELICVSNFSAVARPSYQLDVPDDAQYEILLNTDAKDYSGSDSLALTGTKIDLPPLTTIWLSPRRSRKKR
ncbi:MAG TPA: alpha amylase C-terminal domain-containing protein, partial [Pyrinomonadaceae bacterium]|nr:alpha amylase C-terminal domain-containing protein [Pyrinomonadaceae bacterium]